MGYLLYTVFMPEIVILIFLTDFVDLEVSKPQY